MEEKKDIERIFQERFKQFEAAPPQDMWSRIEARLDDKKKRRVIPIIWWQLGGVAAVLAIVVAGYMLGNNSFTNTNQDQNGLVIEQPNDIDSSSDQSGTQNDQLDNQKASPINTGVATTSDESGEEENSLSNKGNTVSKPSSAIATVDNEASAKNTRDSYASSTGNAAAGSTVDNTIAVNDAAANNARRTSNSDDAAVAYSSTGNNMNQGKTLNNSISDILELPNKEKSDGVAAVDPAAGVPEGTDKDMMPTNQESLQDIADAVTVAGNDSNKDNEPRDILNNRWSAATIVAPVFANNFSGSSINNNVGDASGDTNISYGVAVDYNISSRLSVRTGVHQMNVVYNTNDVSYNPPISAIAVAGSAPGSGYNASAVNRSDAVPTDNSFSQELVSANNFNGFQGELSQQLGYVEVPLELKYRLVDRKLGINVLGGFSALFLTDNEVNISGNGRRLELGEDRNFQNFNQSANFGLGLDYQFTDKIGLSVEPTFKYQLNTLRNDAADFRPYTIGVYTGLMYRF